jgi:predicted GIY-YIG superfamily endonuclease
MVYYCYLIAFTENNSIKRTYIGITNNLEKRIKQHNGLIKGGAKSTRCSDQWFYYMKVGNFKDKGEALSFEYNWKHSKSGIGNKIKRLRELLFEPKWRHLNPLMDIINM